MLDGDTGLDFFRIRALGSCNVDENVPTGVCLVCFLNFRTAGVCSAIGLHLGFIGTHCSDSASAVQFYVYIYIHISLLYLSNHIQLLKFF